METSVISVVDLDIKRGVGKKGPWTLCVLSGTDEQQYKTFDEKIIAQLRQAQAAGAAIAVTYEPEPRSYIDRNGTKRDTVEQTIKSVALASAKPSVASSKAAPVKADKMPPEYWEKKDRLEFQRMAHMSALKACADLMAACIASKVESYKFHDAIQLVKVEADKLYAGFFKSYEGGNHGSVEEANDDGYDTAINE